MTTICDHQIFRESAQVFTAKDMTQMSSSHNRRLKYWQFLLRRSMVSSSRISSNSFSTLMQNTIKHQITLEACRCSLSWEDFLSRVMSWHAMPQMPCLDRSSYSPRFRIPSNPFKVWHVYPWVKMVKQFQKSPNPSGSLRIPPDPCFCPISCTFLSTMAFTSSSRFILGALALAMSTTKRADIKLYPRLDNIGWFRENHGTSHLEMILKMNDI